MIGTAFAKQQAVG